VTVSPDQVRGIALALPGVTEEDDHGRPSFRVERRVFAVQTTPTTLHLMPSRETIRSAVARNPEWFRPVRRGLRVGAVEVDLTEHSPAFLEALITEAWIDQAPTALLPELQPP
jgi:hypothetical protein